MKLKYIPLNCIDEDSEILAVNASTIKINGTFYVFQGTIFDNLSVQKTSNNYIQSVTFDGSIYSISVLRKYTKNNSEWCDLSYVDMSDKYTNETVANAIIIQGET
jgi:hypothetical protein